GFLPTGPRAIEGVVFGLLRASASSVSIFLKQYPNFAHTVHITVAVDGRHKMKTNASNGPAFSPSMYGPDNGVADVFVPLEGFLPVKQGLKVLLQLLVSLPVHRLSSPPE